MTLNLCSGPFPMKGTINADIRKYQGTDVVCDAKALPFKNNSFDKIYFIHSIEHFSYDEGIDICKNLLNKLKPKGRVWIEGPDISKCSGNPEYIFGSLQEIRRDELYRHKWGYSDLSISRNLAFLGYSIVEVSLGTYHGMPHRDYRVIGEKHG